MPILTNTQSMLAAPPRPAVLVLGIGNILLRDEGIGVHVVDAMQRIDLPPGVELLDGATAGLDLLDALADRRKVIVIDAMAGDHAPGTVLRLSPQDLLPSTDPDTSLHDIGVLETLTVAEQLGIAPQEVVIFGITPQRVTYGLDLSPQLAGLVPTIVDLVLKEVQEEESCTAGDDLRESECRS